jgi:hypothetical protein
VLCGLYQQLLVLHLCAVGLRHAPALAQYGCVIQSIDRGCRSPVVWLLYENRSPDATSNMPSRLQQYFRNIQPVVRHQVQLLKLLESKNRLDKALRATFIA